jgi:hypothetical protein
MDHLSDSLRSPSLSGLFFKARVLFLNAVSGLVLSAQAAPLTSGQIIEAAPHGSYAAVATKTDQHREEAGDVPLTVDVPPQPRDGPARPTIADETDSSLAQASDAPLLPDLVTLDRDIAILRGTDSQAKTALAKQITADPGSYFPPLFIPLANHLYAAGDLKEACVWLGFARMRGRYDTLRSGTPGAQRAFEEMKRTVDPALENAARELDGKTLLALAEEALARDAAAPYAYDHLWIEAAAAKAKYGSVAGRRSPALVSKSRWPALLEQVRQSTRSGIVAQAKAIDAERAKKIPPPSPSEPPPPRTP